MPAQDPASFARCLAPYLKICPSDLALPKPEQRRAAERLLCILSVVSALMGRLDRLPVEAAQDLELDLVQLINAHHFVQVSLLCQLLCMCLLRLHKTFNWTLCSSSMPIALYRSVDCTAACACIHACFTVLMFLHC